MKRILENKKAIGNYDKYESRNPIAQSMLNNFRNSIKSLILKHKDDIKSITEAGCGDGYLTNFLANLKIAPIKAFDISHKLIKASNKYLKNKSIKFYVKNLYQVKKNKESADLVVCCEVLEHLEKPELALKKLKIITNRYLIVSVPNEPIWSILNIIRGKYLTSFGNTPGHIQHWSSHSFFVFISKYFKVIKILKPLPWTMILCKKK